VAIARDRRCRLILQILKGRVGHILNLVHSIECGLAVQVWPREISQPPIANISMNDLVVNITLGNISPGSIFPVRHQTAPSPFSFRNLAKILKRIRFPTMRWVENPSNLAKQQISWNLAGNCFEAKILANLKGVLSLAVI
jgi:hypothetical protein